MNDRVVLDYRLIDQPAGDAFATDAVWTMTRNPLPHDITALLAENGIRVGIVSGIIPGEFTARVTSERHTVDPRAIVTRPGEAKIVPVNGPVANADLRVIHQLNQSAEQVTGTDVECGLRVVAHESKQDSLRLTCQLAIQSGAKQSWLRPNDDKTQFVWNQEKSRTDMPTLHFDVTLDRGDYLVIGPTMEPPGTLGELFFFIRMAAQARQRLLILRGHFNSAETKPSTSLAATAGR